MKKVLRGLGVEIKHTKCLDLTVRMLGFNDHKAFVVRDLNAPLSPLDHELSDVEFAERDTFQMYILAAAGLGAVARELLDRANPTGQWHRQQPGNAEESED